MHEKKVVMLLAESDSSRIVYNELSKHFNVCRVIVEDKPSSKLILKRRLKKLGVFAVMGQVAFKVLVEGALKKRSLSRISDIYSHYNLSSKEIPDPIQVSSINDEQVIEELQSIRPDVIVVNGTRIISEKIIGCTDAKMVNTHVGITPRYRGVHGAYWALTNNDKENCGVTVHLIDRGIDTGSIIYQAVIEPTSEDNFVTYPLIQLAEALPILVKAISDELNGELKTQSRPDLDSKLWSHPTLFQYLKYRIWRGVR